MEWVKGFSNGSNHKSFFVRINNVNVIDIDCWRRGDIWEIEIMGWNIISYNFKWYKRFNEKKVLVKIENIIQNIDEAKLAVFNRLFEKPI